MTEEKLRAYLPLSDSVNAAFSLRHADYAVNWRFDFIVAITCLRAVGHVLHKIDCQNFPEIKDEVSLRFDRWKLGVGDDTIFPHFIEDARNSLLKTYSFTSSDKVAFYDDEYGEFTDDFPHPDIVVSGPFEGEDVITLFYRAHDWWRRELNDISKLILPISERSTIANPLSDGMEI